MSVVDVMPWLAHFDAGSFYTGGALVALGALVMGWWIGR